MSTSKYDVIIWDFNGTILDDIGVCVKMVNELFLRFGLPLTDEEEYRKAFRFPVEEYYDEVRLTEFMPYSQIAEEVAYIYNKTVKNEGIGCFSDIIEVIKELHDKGVKQIILSAAPHDLLVYQIENMGLTEYFDAILGIKDIYAAGKVDIARAWLNSQKAKPETLLLIGDSQHDKEIADLLKAKCILVSRGHVSKQRLENVGVPVYQDGNELLSLIME